MNILFYIIIGWIIGEFFHMTLWEYFKSKFKLDNNKVRTILVFLGIAILIAVVGSGFYRVTTTESVLLTSLSGNKIIKDTPGIKYSLLSSREIINTQKQIMKYPVEYSVDGYEIITSDEKPILVNSFLEYRIINPYKWGIENKDSENKLLILFASKIKHSVQTSNYGYVRKNIKTIEEDISQNLINSEELYGIEIVGINLQLSDTTSVKKSKSEAESQKITSESLKESYISESEALQTKYNSIKDKEFIKYMEFIKSIKQGDIEVIVIPQNLQSFIINTEVKNE